MRIAVFRGRMSVAGILLLGSVLPGTGVFTTGGVIFAATGALAILVVQSGWVRPLLDIRVAAIIDGQEPGASRLHSIYVSGEVVNSLTMPVAAIWPSISPRCSSQTIPGFFVARSAKGHRPSVDHARRCRHWLEAATL